MYNILCMTLDCDTGKNSSKCFKLQHIYQFLHATHATLEIAAGTVFPE